MHHQVIYWCSCFFFFPHIMTKCIYFPFYLFPLNLNPCPPPQSPPLTIPASIPLCFSSERVPPTPRYSLTLAHHVFEGLGSFLLISYCMHLEVYISFSTAFNVFYGELLFPWNIFFISSF